MANRETSEINAGSMADIAFLLLIFFLVATTIDIDSGLQQKLPPWEKEPTNNAVIHHRNIFTVLVNSNDKLLVEDEYMELTRLRAAAKAFINNNGSGSCNYCKESAGKSTSSDHPQKAVISFQNDRGTSYSTYIAVQNELVAAYSELRNELAQRQYGSDYRDLDVAQQKEIKKAYPQKISEAEPVDLSRP